MATQGQKGCAVMGMFLLGGLCACIFAFLFALVRQEVRDTVGLRFPDRATYCLSCSVVICVSLVGGAVAVAVNIGTVGF